MLKKVVFIRNHILALILLTFVCAAIWSNSLHNSFVWDDNYLVVDNSYIQHIENIPLFFTPHYWNQLYPFHSRGVYRPVRAVTLAIDYYLWGLHPIGYHLSNVLLHMANTFLVYYLVLLLTGHIKHEGKRLDDQHTAFFSLPFGAALLFAIHPAHTESINLIKNRSDLLAFLFCMGTFILFIKSIGTAHKRRSFFGFC
jgi:protein O-mannosyl-transferase